MDTCYFIVVWNIAGSEIKDGPYETKETAIHIARDMVREGLAEDDHIGVIGPIAFTEVNRE